MVEQTLAGGQVTGSPRIRVSSVRFGGQTFSPEEFRSRFGGRPFGGRGIIQAPFLLIRSKVEGLLTTQRAQARLLETRRPEIETTAIRTDEKIKAFNTIQQAINRGDPIPADAIAFLGLKTTDLIGSKWKGVRSRLQTEQLQAQTRIDDYNTRVKNLSDQIARPTAIEQEVRASLQGRGLGIAIQRAQEEKFVTPPVKFTKVSGIKPQDRLGIFVEETGRAFYGEPGTETGFFQFGEGQVRTLPVLTKKGGIGQRVGGAFFGITGYGAEVGQRIAGPIGGIVGGAVALPFGAFFGAYEGAIGTSLKSVQKGLVEPTFGPLVGAGYEFAGTLFVGPKAFVKTAKAGVTVLGKTAPKAISGIRGLETSRSIYGRTPVTDTFTKAVFGVQKVAPTVSRLAQRRIVQYPALYGTALSGPTVAEQAVLATFPETIKTEKAQLVIQRTTERDIAEASKTGQPLPQFLIGGTQVGLGETTGALGQSLGLGATGIEELGGGRTERIKQIALEEARLAGFKGKEAQLVAKAATEARIARQIGGLAGFVGIEALGELQGRKLIGQSLTSFLTGKAIGVGGKKAFKETVKGVAPQIPKFAALGFQEGVLGIATSELLTRQAKTPLDLPQRIAQDPLKFALGGVAGAISAPLIGVPALGGSIFKTLRGGSKVGGAVERGFLGLGYILDPIEKVGDDFVDLVGTAEPRFRVRTIAGTATQELDTGVTVRRPRTLNILEPFGVPSQQPIEQIEKRRGSIYPPTSTDLFGGVTTPSSIQNIFTDFIGVEKPTQQDIIDKTIEEQTEQQVTQQTPVTINIPIGVPVSKGGIPPFLPLFGGTGGGRGRRPRGGRTFFNEFQAAGVLLGRNLLRQGKELSRRQRNLFDLRPRRRTRRSRK